MFQTTKVVQSFNKHLNHPFPFKPVIAAIALFSCVFTAVAIVPGTMPNPPMTTVIEELALPEIEPVESLNSSLWREERVQAGDTLARFMNRVEVDDPEALAFIKSDATARKIISSLRQNKMVRVETDQEGKLRSLRFTMTPSNEILVFREGGRLFATEQTAKLEKRVIMRSGIIQSSLLQATDKAKIPESVAFQMADILGTKIDFLRDIRVGDNFTVVYEAQYNHGRQVSSGKILALEFNNRNKTYQALHFEDGTQNGAYYTPDFKPLKSKTGFLRSPLEFSRVTSGFSMRKHPIFNDWRQHKGVDYAAPTGTRIRSTASGVVKFAGTQRGYGNVVVVSHAGKFETLYAHMNGIASGIKVGTKIEQGQLIGYVGSTGWATGPHLHYEVRKNGQHVNPLDRSVVIALDDGSLAKQEKAFHQAKEPLLASLQLAKDSAAMPANFE